MYIFYICIHRYLYIHIFYKYLNICVYMYIICIFIYMYKNHWLFFSGELWLIHLINGSYLLSRTEIGIRTWNWLRPEEPAQHNARGSRSLCYERLLRPASPRVVWYGSLSTVPLHLSCYCCLIKKQFSPCDPFFLLISILQKNLELPSKVN